MVRVEKGNDGEPVPKDVLQGMHDREAEKIADIERHHKRILDMYIEVGVTPQEQQELSTMIEGRIDEEALVPRVRLRTLKDVADSLGISLADSKE